jgi:hypothetical protein
MHPALRLQLFWEISSLVLNETVAIWVFRRTQTDKICQ